MGKLIGVPELADRLSISARQVYRMVEEDRIPHYRAGRLIRFDADAVLTALRKDPGRAAS
jgi:excisionase family DNA binding protein